MSQPPILCICGGTLSGEAIIRPRKCLCNSNTARPTPRSYFYYIRLRPLPSRRNPTALPQPPFIQAVFLDLQDAVLEAELLSGGNQTYARSGGIHGGQLERLEGRWRKRKQGENVLEVDVVRKA